MRLSRKQNKNVPLIRHGHPGDLWHALACLRAAHPDPVGIDEPFEPTRARLSIARPEDVVLSARVELFEDETVSRLHDVIDTVTRDLAGAKGFGAYALVPDVALEVMIGVRQELPLHTGHVGLTRLVQAATGTILARSTPGGGQCYHCEGTGRARPLWKRSLSAGHDVA